MYLFCRLYSHSENCLEKIFGGVVMGQRPLWGWGKQGRVGRERRVERGRSREKK